MNKLNIPYKDINIFYYNIIKADIDGVIEFVDKYNFDVNEIIEYEKTHYNDVLITNSNGDILENEGYIVKMNKGRNETAILMILRLMSNENSIFNIWEFVKIFKYLVDKGAKLDNWLTEIMKVDFHNVFAKNMEKVNCYYQNNSVEILEAVHYMLFYIISKCNYKVTVNDWENYNNFFGNNVNAVYEKFVVNNENNSQRKILNNQIFELLLKNGEEPSFEMLQRTSYMNSVLGNNSVDGFLYVQNMKKTK